MTCNVPDYYFPVFIDVEAYAAIRRLPSAVVTVGFLLRCQFCCLKGSLG